MSIAGKRKSTIGVGHDGAIKQDNGAPVYTHHSPAIARGMEAQTHTRATLGKPPKPKGYSIGIHNGMRTVNRATGEFVDSGHLAAYDSNSGNPLNSGPPRGKRLTVPAPVPGQRSRIQPMNADAMRELSRQVMAEAYSVAEPDHPSKLGIGVLPSATTEK
jgi:hypothetical protein